MIAAWRGRLAVGLGVVVVLLGAASAEGHDSMAPAGALHQWLPADRWIQEHWIPFDQRRLEHALGLRGRQLEAYLVNDHHTLADLARLRGVDVDRLADDLLAPWRPLASAEHVAMLRGRTMQILTQGHLAQHVFFHVYHSLGSTFVARELFGVSSIELDALRRQRQTPLAVAKAHGKSEAALTAGLTDLLRGHRDDGVRLQEAWPAQSDRTLARQVKTLPCWLRSLRPSMDWGNPYGKARHQHGRHPAGWPATPAQKRRDERRVQRFWRKLEWTCWPRVPAWRWPESVPALQTSKPASWARPPLPTSPALSKLT